jgi:hypothetical protein
LASEQNVKFSANERAASKTVAGNTDHLVTAIKTTSTVTIRYSGTAEHDASKKSKYSSSK